MHNVNIEQLVATLNAEERPLWQLISLNPQNHSSHSAFEFLQQLAGDQLDSPGEQFLGNALELIGGDINRDKLRELVVAFLENNGSAKRIRDLLTTVAEANSSPQPPHFTSPPVDVAHAGSVEHLHFKANTSAGFTLSSAKAFDPDGPRGPLQQSTPMELAVFGELSAGANAELPLSLGGVGGSVGLGTTAAGSARLVSHYRAAPNDLIAEAGIKLLRDFASPFALGDLQRALVPYGEQGPQGYTLQSDQAMGATVSVALLEPLALFEQLPTEVGVSLSASISRKGAVSISTYREAPAAITVVVRRSKANLNETELALGITLDPAELLLKAQGILQENLTTFAELMQELEEYTAPSGKLRNLLKRELAERLAASSASEQVLPLINAALGFDKETTQADAVLENLSKLLAVFIYPIHHGVDTQQRSLRSAMRPQGLRPFRYHGQNTRTLLRCSTFL